MTTTGNLGLKKPDYTDSADIGDINDNMDILDKEVEDRLSKENGGTVNGEVNFGGDVSFTGGVYEYGIALEEKYAATDHTHTTDSEVTGGSTNLITSGAVYTAIENAEDKINDTLGAAASRAIDTTVTSGSSSLPTSGAVYTALQGLATASIVIAASDTDDTLKARANYTCTGTSDQTIINTAIASLSSGGKVVLLPGTYVTSGTINISKDNIWLCGCGYSTVIQSTAANCIIYAYGNYITVSDMTLDCYGYGLSFFANNAYGASFGTARNLIVKYSTYAGVLCEASDSTNVLAGDCAKFMNIITICSEDENPGYAFHIYNERKALIIGCVGVSADGETASRTSTTSATYVGCVGYDV